MVSVPDFNLAFRDGTVMPGGAVIERRDLGELHLPSGRLLACDPAFAEEPPFALMLPPGRYPVILSIAVMKNDKRVACAMLQVKAETPVTWKHALREGDKPNSQPAFGVDSATAAFMDEQAAMLWQVVDSDFSAVTDQMDYTYGDTCCWGNITLNTDEGQLNAAIFSTGYGDGFYRSYWGYSADGEVACLVTDFGILKPSVE